MLGLFVLAFWGTVMRDVLGLHPKGSPWGTLYVAGVIAALLAGIVAIALYLKILLWKCPRCGRHIAQNLPRQKPFTSSCLNCGFPTTDSESVM